MTTMAFKVDTDMCDLGPVMDGGGLPGWHDFQSIDEHAKKATHNNASSFPMLTQYLEEAFPSDPKFRDLFLVRGLLIWLCHNQETDEGIRFFKSLRTTGYSHASVIYAFNRVIEGGTSTDVNKGPREVLYATDTGELSLQAGFHMLCRKNNIPSKVITGITRALVDYEPGSRGVADTWNAVLIDDKWRLIHPVLAAVSTSGHVTGGWIEKESDGMISHKRVQESHGKNRIEFRDYWFCAKPWEFVYFCYPDDDNYQFLAADDQVKSVKAFLSMPCVYPPYFQRCLEVIQNKSCCLKSDGRKVEVVIQVPKGRALKFNLSYKLYVEDTVKMESELKNITGRLVLNARDITKDTFSFEVRFPVEGVYKLEIFTIEFSIKQRCCVFKIRCTHKTNDFRKLPIDPGPSGWGFIPKAEQFGLRQPSNTSPKLQIKPLRNKKESETRLGNKPPESTEPGACFLGSTGPGINQNSSKPEIAQIVNLSFDIDPKSIMKTEYNSVIYGSDFVEDEQKELQEIAVCFVSLHGVGSRTCPGSSGVDVIASTHHVSTTKDVDNCKLKVNATVPCDGEYALVVEAAETGSDFEPVCSYLLTTLDDGSDEGKFGGLGALLPTPYKLRHLPRVTKRNAVISYAMQGVKARFYPPHDDCVDAGDTNDAIDESAVDVGDKDIVVNENDVDAGDKHIVVDENDVDVGDKHIVADENDVDAGDKYIVVDENDVDVGDKDIVVDENDADVGDTYIVFDENDADEVDKDIIVDENDAGAGDKDIVVDENDIDSVDKDNVCFVFHV